MRRAHTTKKGRNFNYALLSRAEVGRRTIERTIYHLNVSSDTVQTSRSEIIPLATINARARFGSGSLFDSKLPYRLTLYRGRKHGKTS